MLTRDGNLISRGHKSVTSELLGLWMISASAHNSPDRHREATPLESSKIPNPT
jgi:hypothetical protein